MYLYSPSMAEKRADDRPAWKKAFDAVEKSVAPKLEQAVRTDQFADAAAALTKVQGQMQKRVEKASRDALHRANMPAATDVKRLADQMASLERRMHEIAKQQHEILDLLRKQLGQSAGSTKNMPSMPSSTNSTRSTRG